jgi:isopentenyl diphosphate isomerase/L-lactate dehydrogenase-like FMN-dependent dehydrogenase
MENQLRRDEPSHVENLLTIDDFEEVAHGVLPGATFDYYAGGSGDLSSLHRNREAYSSLAVHYRVFRDVENCDLSCEILGHKLQHPVLAAPTAFHCLANPEGEVATARGLCEAGALMTLSSLSTRTVEDVAAAGAGPKWFQLYINRDRGFTRDLMARVEAAGYSAIVVTADTPRWGRRHKDIRNGFHLPPGLEAVNLVRSHADATTLSHSGAGLGSSFDWMLDASLTWRDFEAICAGTKLPVLIKGVCRPEDALSAFVAGAAGVVVSNHGGRQMESAPATIAVLLEIRTAVGPDRLLIVDGGIRCGVDVLKALALGANAVQIGRPVLWGLAAGGATGVSRVVNTLRTELEQAMVLAGAPSLADITPDLVREWTIGGLVAKRG